MPNSVPGFDPCIRAAFDEACLTVFSAWVQRPFDECESHEVLQGFAAHYRQLSALPRRARRAMERRWKRTLSAIALLMALGQAPALAANIHVSPGTPPSIK